MELISTKPLQPKFIVRSMTPDDHNDVNQLEADLSSNLQTSPTFLHSSLSD